MYLVQSKLKIILYDNLINHITQIKYDHSGVEDIDIVSYHAQ